MWLAGALGLAAGLGYYAVGLAGALIGFVVIAVIRLFEPKGRRDAD